MTNHAAAMEAPAPAAGMTPVPAGRAPERALRILFRAGLNSDRRRRSGNVVLPGANHAADTLRGGRAVSGNGQRRKVAITSLAILSLLYALVELVPGRFVVTDEVFYKAAGRNWAMSGKFAAPEIVGRFGQGPPLSETFFAQPPLYPFLFGVLTKLVGFGPRACILYDVLIHILLIWSLVVTARVVFALAWGPSALCGALFLPLGTVGRADELGVVFALWAAIAFRSKMSRRSSALIGGALLGLCCATCLGAFVFLGPLAAWELISLKQDKLATIASLCTAVAAGMAAVAVCVAPILVNHPTAYQQLLANAGEQSGILSMVTGNGWRTRGRLSQLWAIGLRDGLEYVALAIGLALFALLCWWLDESRSAPANQRLLPAALSLIFTLILLDGRYPYFLFPTTWFFIACVAMAAQAFQSMPRRCWIPVFGLGACVWLAASMPYLHRKAVMLTLPADQSLDVNMQRVRAVIPPGVGVMTSEYWWMLADRDRVYDPLFGSPNPEDVDFIVVSGNGSGKPGVPRRIKPEYEQADMQIVCSHLNPTPESVFGFPISHSAYGFGAYILRSKVHN
jgi:hypothetical protein